jgi:hypothetical protein
MSAKRFLIKFSFAAVLFLISQIATAQKSPLFYEVIQGDSVALFFNEDNTFTEKDCRHFTRVIRVTEAGDFNGHFEDYRIDNTLLARGAYLKGIKHGYFEFYYPNGKISSKGYYSNNAPTGIWEYFYENGLPERTLNIVNWEVFLMRYVDSDGVVRIKDGNGKFEDYFPRFLNFYNVRVYGRIVNGRPHGRWIAEHPTQKNSLYVERFENGTLVRTSYVPKKKMTNKVSSSLCNFFPANYLPSLEGFYFEDCSESLMYTNNVWLNNQILRADLTRRIDVLIESDFQKHDIGHYTFGDSYVLVEFSVNKQGRATDIQLLSDWGGHFYDIIKSCISRAVFSTRNESMYFKMKVSYGGGRKYRYSFKFSKHKGGDLRTDLKP